MDDGCSVLVAELQRSIRDGTQPKTDYLRAATLYLCPSYVVPSAAPMSGAEGVPLASSPLPVASPAVESSPAGGGPTGPPANDTGPPGNSSSPVPAPAPEHPSPHDGIVSSLLRSAVAAAVATAVYHCADFCVYLGIAARAIWWIFAGTAAFAVISFLWAIWSCFLPVWCLFWKSFRYLTGRAPPPDPLATGEAACEIIWHGPGVNLPWTGDYEAKVVKARGEQRLPYDLLIAHFHNGNRDQVARLRHDALVGRSNRHGYIVNYLEIVSCSSKEFRDTLLGAPLLVHLCASDP